MTFVPIDTDIQLVACPGNELVQTQHLGLLTAWQQNAATFNNNRGRIASRVCKDFLAFMRGYSLAHFRTEELWHQQRQWSDAEAHRVIHKDFTKLLAELSDLVYDSADSEFLPEDVTRKVLEAVEQWLCKHINKEDPVFYAALTELTPQDLRECFNLKMDQP